MQIQNNISLKPYNTFGIDVDAKHFVQLSSHEDVQTFYHEFRHHSQAHNEIILGGGSNILFTAPVNGYVLKNDIVGIDKLQENDIHVWVRAGGGVEWHSFVLYCIENGWAGVENMSLIPGTIGAGPLQNIGAYGVELKDVLYELRALQKSDGEIVTFTNTDCEFGYRESIFKKKYKDQFFILDVTYKLSKHPVLNTTYGAIQAQLEKMGVTKLSIKAVSDAIIAIRSSKLPNPKLTGNAGSFFKNPTVPIDQYNLLKEKFPQVVSFKNLDGSIKLAAGWLIEYCGWKGYRQGDAGVHPLQALVLVNYGHATGKEILTLSDTIIASVQDKTGVLLEREVNIF